MDMKDTLAQLRRLMPEAMGLSGPETAAPRALGAAGLDSALCGGLRPGALHEVYAASAREAGAAAGFALGLAGRLMGANAMMHRTVAHRTVAPGTVVSGTMPLFWLRQTMAEREFGRIYGPGLAEMGLDPRALVRVSASRTEDLLEAALQAARGLKRGVILLEPYGTARELDMTAARRLALAAEASAGGVTLIALFTGRAVPCPSPALSRWCISASPAADGPRHLMGQPRFRVELIRSRTGQTGAWFVEWNSDESVFSEHPERQTADISRPRLPVSAHRPPDAQHGGAGWQRAG